MHEWSVIAPRRSSQRISRARELLCNATAKPSSRALAAQFTGYLGKTERLRRVDRRPVGRPNVGRPSTPSGAPPSCSAFGVFAESAAAVARDSRIGESPGRGMACLKNVDRCQNCQRPFSRRAVGGVTTSRADLDGEARTADRQPRGFRSGLFPVVVLPVVVLPVVVPSSRVLFLGARTGPLVLALTSAPHDGTVPIDLVGRGITPHPVRMDVGRSIGPRSGPRVRD